MRYFAGVWSPRGDFNVAARIATRMADWFESRSIKAVSVKCSDDCRLVIGRKSMDSGVNHSDAFTKTRPECLFGDLELYNREEISERLGGFEKRNATATDLDIVNNWLARREIDGIRDIVGDFALGHLAGDHCSLTLICDHVGLRSLYWAIENGCLIFASSAAILKRINPAKFQPDERSLAWHALNISPGSNRSYITHVKRVIGGHMITFDRKLKPTTKRYWKPELRTPAITSFDEAVERLEEKVFRAVTLRCQLADKIGITLSGGLDSTLIANIAARRDPSRKVECFTSTKSVPDQEVFDETDWAEQVISAHRNLILHRSKGRSEDLLSGMKCAPLFQASPLRQITFFQKEALYREAHKSGASVIFSGTGGDEALSVWGMAGYRSLLLRGKLVEAWKEAKHRYGTNIEAAIHIFRALVSFTGLNKVMFSKQKRFENYYKKFPLAWEHIDFKAISDEFFSSGVIPSTPANSVREEIRNNLERSIQTGQFDIDLELPYRFELGFRYPLLDWQLLEAVLELAEHLIASVSANRKIMRALVSRSGSLGVSRRTDKGVFAPDFVTLFRQRSGEVEEILREMKHDPAWQHLYNHQSLVMPLENAVRWDRFDDIVERRIVPVQIARFLSYD